MKRIVLLTLVIGFSLAFNVSELQAQKVGDPAPDFSLQTLKGKTFTLSQQKGKVVFIFLFGNSCSHCLANGPNTQKIYEKFMDDPDFVAIGVDVWNGNASSVNSFKSRTGITYDLALDGAALTSSYSTTYDRILVVDREGILHYKATSNATSGVSDMVSDELEELLKSGSTGINEISQENNFLKVYPNPARDHVTVETGFSVGADVQLSLIDLSGKVVLEEKLKAGQSGEMIIRLDSYTKGIYFLRATSGVKNLISKIVVE